MSLLGGLSQLLRYRYASAFEKATFIPKETQWEKLKLILEKNANTEFGKKYNFSSIKSVSDYQKLLPISKHSDLKPFLDKMVKGEKNILTAEEPLYYCMTSGSTGEPKLTPITPSYRDEYQSVVQTFLYHVYKDHPKAFSGKVIYFNGSAELRKTPAGVSCGTMSGFNFRNLPNIVKKFYAVPYEITVINDLNSRNYIMALLTLQKNISMMIGITGAPIITFIQTIKNNLANILKDLHDGTINKDLVLTKEEIAFIQTLHKPNPSLAKLIEKKVAEEKGVFKPHKIWENLDLLICWKSSTAGGYLRELSGLFDNTIVIRDAIYSATEGWCNIPYTDKVNGGPLAIKAHFYEFIEENDENNEKVFTTEQLEVGKRYRILYTTSAGMYRYDIGDILEVTEKYNNTPCMKFVCKAGRSCNIVGEKMTEHHVNQAIQNTSDKFNLTIPFYTMLPNQSAYPPNYNCLIELPEDLDKKLYEEIALNLDKELGEQNWEYKSHRDAGDLAPLSLKLVEKGSMKVFREQQVRLGADSAQVKPLVLAQDMTKLSDIKLLE